VKDLVEALEKVYSLADHIADEQTYTEQRIAEEIEGALVLARGYAASVDMLTETIIGNVQHVMAMWVDVQAARWERKANEVEQWEAAESYLTRAHAYRDIARGIREGAWRE
jgi:hypothetical protein